MKGSTTQEIEKMETEIGSIGNYYGGLSVKAEPDGTFWWGIENYSGTTWEQIPQSLYDELVKFGSGVSA